MRKQEFFYNTIRGKLLSGHVREHFVLKHLEKIGKGESFLEVGCASGHYVANVLDKCGKAVGIDLDLADIEHAKKNVPGGEFHSMDAAKLAFRDKEFDWVLCSEVLEHIPDWKKVGKEMKRVCRKNILITIPLEKGCFWRAMSLVWPMKYRYHVHALSTKDVEKAMKPFRLVEKDLVHMPSMRFAKKYSKKGDEKYAIYAVMLFSA